jgi:hypothetical protein
MDTGYSAGGELLVDMGVSAAESLACAYCNRGCKFELPEEATQMLAEILVWAFELGISEIGFGFVQADGRWKVAARQQGAKSQLCARPEVNWQVFVKVSEQAGDKVIRGHYEGTITMVGNESGATAYCGDVEVRTGEWACRPCNKRRIV